MTKSDLQFKIRLSGDLKERLEALAAGAGRSLTAEIVQRLEASLKTSTDAMQAELIERFERMHVQMMRMSDRLAAVDPKFAKERKAMEALSEKLWAEERAKTARGDRPGKPRKG
jgi:predicted DNA-binding protein